jgi:GT2 family glycosyltransferase
VIPVLAIPALNRPDLLRRCLASIDVPVDRLFVIDNSPDGSMGQVADEAGVEVIDVGANLGVAASWNLAIKANAQAPWWAFANVDTEFGPGDLARLDAAMAENDVACLRRFAAFGLSAAVVEKVGLFDENFAPIYCEDADYEYRCRLAGVWIVDLPSGTQELEGGSVSYRSDPRLAERNAQTYPANVAYYEAKWGGPLRGGERYTTPFDRGGSIADWTLDVRRLREQAW